MLSTVRHLLLVSALLLLVPSAVLSESLFRRVANSIPACRASSSGTDGFWMRFSMGAAGASRIERVWEEPEEKLEALPVCGVDECCFMREIKIESYFQRLTTSFVAVTIGSEPVLELNLNKSSVMPPSLEDIFGPDHFWILEASWRFETILAKLPLRIHSNVFLGKLLKTIPSNR